MSMHGSCADSELRTGAHSWGAETDWSDSGSGWVGVEALLALGKLRSA